MQTLEPETLAHLHKTLQEALPEAHWRTVLFTLAVTGVADNLQLVRATGLQRDKLRRVLDKLTALTVAYPPLYTLYPHKLPRGAPGTRPYIYRLAETGAALCRLEGVAEAHACQLDDPRPIRHALGMLDVHLAARQAGLPVVTDRQLAYGDGYYIRPDNLITIPNGNQLIFETEQDARTDFLERILRSLAHKVAFFAAQPHATVLPQVRMLVEVPREKLWPHTLKIWRQAVDITRTTQGSLPFTLWAVPLGEFLTHPAWEADPDPARWVDLTAPERLPLGELNPTSLAQVAQTLPVFSNQERQMVLAALLQEVGERGAFAELPAPDVDFLYVMRTIYLASHDPFLPPLQRSGVPREALYLLDQYLKMHPDLQKRLLQTMQMDARRIHWNQTTALHRMQVVVDAFLAYHGWQSDGPLCVYTYTPDYQARGPRRMSVAVEITDPNLLKTQVDDLVPGPKEIRLLEQALAWVLTSLFAATPSLGLKKPPVLVNPICKNYLRNLTMSQTFSCPPAQVFPLASEFEAALLAQDRAPLTIRGYLRDVRLFAQWYPSLGGTPFCLAQWTGADCRAYRQALEVAGTQPATINRKLAALSAYGHWAVQAGHLALNPALHLRNVETQPLAPKWLDKRQRAALVRAVEKDLQNAQQRYPRLWLLRLRDVTMVLLVLHTGLRVSEVCALRVEDLTLSARQGQVRVRAGKGQKQRTVPLNQPARQRLEAWLAVRPDTPALFSGQRGAKVTVRAVQRAVSRAAKLADLTDVTPHTLRHSFAKALLDAGVTLEKVAALLGHQNLNTTRIYTAPGSRDLEDAVARLED